MMIVIKLDERTGCTAARAAGRAATPCASAGPRLKQPNMNNVKANDKRKLNDTCNHYSQLQTINQHKYQMRLAEYC